jgi:hypothetical protein
MATVYTGRYQASIRSEEAGASVNQDFQLTNLNGVDATAANKHGSYGGTLTVRGLTGSSVNKFHKIIPFTIRHDGSSTLDVVTHTALLDYNSNGTFALTVTLSISTTNLRAALSVAGGDSLRAVESWLELNGYRDA